MVKPSPDKFAVIFSISHVLSDGHTRSKIYNMLDANVPRVSLECKRVHSFMQSLEKLSGGDDSEKWFHSFGTMMSFLCNIMFSSKIPEPQIQLVDSEWIKEMKHSPIQNDDKSFISTNDVLTSWIMRESNYDVGIMAINYRNRISGITNENAGNYESVIAYQHEDYKEPALIRKSLTTFRRPITEKLPTFQKSPLKRICVVSNWCTFFHQVEFTNCKHVMFLPLGSSQNRKYLPFDLYTIFKPSKDQVACRAITRHCTGDVFPVGSKLVDPIQFWK